MIGESDNFTSKLELIEGVKIWMNNSEEEKSAPNHGEKNEKLPVQGEIMKRFTIDVSEDLHKRIKTQCALRGAKMADVMRKILEQEFPKR